jgi:nucleoside-diphosphate-sugar epimerase
MRFELVTAPGQGAFADAVALLLAVGGLADEEGAFVETVLPDDAGELNAFASGLRTGGYLPVLYDEAQVVEVTQPAAILRHVARAGGLDGGSVATAALRGDLAAESSLRFMKELAAAADPARAARAHLRALGAILSQRCALDATGDDSAPAPATTVLTYGDFLAWLYMRRCVDRLGAGVFATQPHLGRLYAALGARADVAAFAARRFGDAVGAAAAAATTDGAAAASAGSSSSNSGAAATPAPARPLAAPAAATAAPAAAPASVKGPICVTGASSFIGSWVVATLLQRGYTVRGTVRSLEGAAGAAASGAPAHRYAHLTSLPGAAERLTLHGADLLTPGAFDGAVAGCTAVIHCASPFFFTPKVDAHAELIRPAVEGTSNVMRSAVAAPSVRKVVLTSSMASVYVTKLPADHFYTEADWSDLEHIRSTGQVYAESKLLAEREAWRIIAEEQPPGRGLELATICPTQTLGPLLQPYLNQSATAVVEYASGAKKSIPAKGKVSGQGGEEGVGCWSAHGPHPPRDSHPLILS